MFCAAYYADMAKQRGRPRKLSTLITLSVGFPRDTLRAVDAKIRTIEPRPSRSSIMAALAKDWVDQPGGVKCDKTLQ